MPVSLSLGSGFMTLEIWPPIKVMGPCSQVHILLMTSLGRSVASMSYNDLLGMRAKLLIVTGASDSEIHLHFWSTCPVLFLVLVAKEG